MHSIKNAGPTLPCLLDIDCFVVDALSVLQSAAIQGMLVLQEIIPLSASMQKHP